MKKSTIKSMLLKSTLVLFLFNLYACNKEDEKPDSSIAYGTEISMGNGKVQSFIKSDDKGTPTSIGFKMSEKALENLPHDHGNEVSFVLDLPAGKSISPYNHISIDWTMHGHGPEGVYDKPHFDMHFYMLSQTERQDIKMDDRMEILPDTSFLPKLYFGAPGEGVPQMGKHWVDLTSPELNGKQFTATFIYGSYNGQVVFNEPMVTLDFLNSKPDTTITLRQPKAFQKSGFYPGKYSIKYDQAKKEYAISLDDLQLKQK